MPIKRSRRISELAILKEKINTFVYTETEAGEMGVRQLSPSAS